MHIKQAKAAVEADARQRDAAAHDRAVPKPRAQRNSTDLDNCAADNQTLI